MNFHAILTGPKQPNIGALDALLTACGHTPLRQIKQHYDAEQGCWCVTGEVETMSKLTKKQEQSIGYINRCIDGSGVNRFTERCGSMIADIPDEGLRRQAQEVRDAARALEAMWDSFGKAFSYKYGDVTND